MIVFIVTYDCLYNNLCLSAKCADISDKLVINH